MGAMNLREAAEQALEALEKNYRGAEECARILRAALAEVNPSDMTEGELAAYRAGWQQCTLNEPKRKPLTDEEIEEVISSMRQFAAVHLIAFARAIERAHGIGGE